MKTPEQWMGEAPLGTDRRGRDIKDIDEKFIAAIQQDAIGHEYGRFTEATLNDAGWYWWIPAKKTLRPQFMRVAENENMVQFAGTYIGPVVPPKL